ncbi:MAG: ABC transporter ATP-binding protein [Candidatus Woesearchaeota archaeon]|jgi:ABC-2 type transport system ATP-binding protein
MHALLVENVSKQFDKFTAVNNVSFHIDQGEIFGLLGPNGAGKTTLISMIADLLTKDSGKIEIFGLKKAQHLMNVLPGFTHVNNPLTIDEFLKEYSLLYSVKNWKKEREYVLNLLEIEEQRNEKMMDLSSGYKQRVLLAKALLTKPKLLLMDEPTVGLDIEIAIKIRGIIKELKKKGYTILLTTHNMLEVEELCDRIALINQGKIVAEGTVKEVKKKIVEQNSILIECENPTKIVSLFKKESYVINTKLLKTGCIIYVRQNRKIKTIMKKLSEQEEKVYSIEIMEPTLEEAFIKLTSRRKK